MSATGQSREILRLAVPAFLALVAEPLFLLTDSAIVGHLGTEPLAGLGIASAILLTAAFARQVGLRLRDFAGDVGLRARCDGGFKIPLRATSAPSYSFNSIRRPTDAGYWPF